MSTTKYRQLKRRLQRAEEQLVVRLQTLRQHRQVRDKLAIERLLQNIGQLWQQVQQAAPTEQVQEE